MLGGACGEAGRPVAVDEASGGGAGEGHGDIAAARIMAIGGAGEGGGMATKEAGELADRLADSRTAAADITWLPTAADITAAGDTASPGLEAAIAPLVGLVSARDALPVGACTKPSESTLGGSTGAGDGGGPSPTGPRSGVAGATDGGAGLGVGGGGGGALLLDDSVCCCGCERRKRSSGGAGDHSRGDGTGGGEAAPCQVDGAGSEAYGPVGAPADAGT